MLAYITRTYEIVKEAELIGNDANVLETSRISPAVSAFTVAFRQQSLLPSIPDSPAILHDRAV